MTGTPTGRGAAGALQAADREALGLLRRRGVRPASCERVERIPRRNAPLTKCRRAALRLPTINAEIESHFG